MAAGRVSMVAALAAGVLAVVGAGGGGAGHGLALAEQDRPVLPANAREEVAMALDAAPVSLREAAAVYVLGDDGYRLAREGTNGVSCLVQRSRPDTMEPVCWDREGSETILPRVLDEARWRAAGVDADAIDRRVADGFASGRYRAPRRPGLAYMLSTENFVFNGERVIKYVPHVMAYAPYLTNADIGATGTDSSAPWVLDEGSPHAYIIIVTAR